MDIAEPKGYTIRMVGAPVHPTHVELKTVHERWFLELEDVPETLLHDMIVELLKLVLKYHFREENVLVASNLACRWEPRDHRLGVAPDVIVVAPVPPEGQKLQALQVWEPGHQPPKLAIEVVSETNADKDYRDGPARLSRLGAEELWLFDPEGYGPSDDGGPYVLQIWRRASGSKRLEVVYAGEGPAYSPVLQAWALVTEDGYRLRIADDEEGMHLWPTYAEAEKDRANTAEDRANTAEDRANTAEDRANIAEDRVNTAESRANTAESRANTAEDRAKAEARARRAAEAEIHRLRLLLQEKGE